MPRSFRKILVPPVPHVVKQYTDNVHKSIHKHEPSLTQLEDHYSQAITKTDVEEVWFAGAHCGMSITPPSEMYSSVLQTSVVALSKTELAIVWPAFRYDG